MRPQLSIKNNDSNTAQTFWVVIGSLASSLFSILSSVILTRFLAKDDYGTYQQVIFVYNSLLAVFTLGLPRAFSYFLPRMSKAQGKDTARKINYMLMLVGAFFSLTIFAAAPLIGRVLDNPDLPYALRWFSPVPLLMLPTMGIEGIYATYRKTHISALYMVLTRIFTLACVALPVMIRGGSYIDAIQGFVAASLLQFILALLLKSRIFKEVKSEKGGASLKEIAAFSIPLMIANLWGWVISSADQFFISRYFGAEVFAEYSNGAINLPFVGIIINATSVVLIPLLSKNIHEKTDFREVMLPTIRSVFAKTAMLTYPIIFFCWFFAPEIIGLLYGESYASSSIYFRIVLVSTLFMLVTTGPVVIAMGANRFFARVHMYGAIILVALEFLCAVYLQSPYAIITVSVICHIGRIMTMFGFIMKSFRISLKHFVPWRVLAEISVPSLILLAGIKYIMTLTTGVSNLVSLAIGGSAYAALFLSWVIFRKIDYLSIIKPLFTRRQDNK